MPLLFAVTLFVSASLLFMVQPMVAKLVLPLLGGSPAVWNACMVFFQALLLLGYLYADRLTRQENPRKQWVIHLCVMALPLAAFAIAVLLSPRHTPIAAAESLAPSDGSSAILSVLAILTVAIGVPFFVVSTSATLLQKWFTYTGHPSARDPYFLYAASNLGSLISLLGYPIFIEPNMTQSSQTWFWAVGFVALFGLIAFCGWAAVNPLGVPPGTALAAGKGSGKHTGGGANAPKAVAADNKILASTPPTEPPPTWARMAKWTLLAFVPSSLMLGVTFHMTTDIASIPLLWVGPLALYLLTFIIAFGHMPPWFRVLIGNLAPVMILLLVFLMISEVKPGVGLELLLYNLTFFAAALMCHYELARDRPSPHYLTTYFLIMSLGGVLGGIFNSLIAPLIFTHSYEFPLVLVIACVMVPKLIPDEDKSTAQKSPAPDTPAHNWLGGWLNEDDYWTVVVGSPVTGLLTLFATLPAYQIVTSLVSTAVTSLAFSALYLFLWRPLRRWYTSLGTRTPWWIALALDLLIPVTLGVIVWQMPRLLGHSEWYASWVKGITQATTRFQLTVNTTNIIVLYALPVMVCFFFVDRPLRFALCVAVILGGKLFREEVNDDVQVIHTERSFFGILKIEDRGYQRRLIHGTTLHGTQFTDKFQPHWSDDFQRLTAMNPLDNLIVAGTQLQFDPRQEPLTYYHRTGPVGAMFSELRTRKGGADARAPFAMVGLGTGSVSCYALAGQKLTFYEIDPVVKRLVADTDKYFTYVKDAERRGGELDFRMGDARLKLKEDTDRKYALLLVDAFSSDSIPVHLLTTEAVQLYLDRLTEDGILALHISNKYVKLEPVVAAIAEHLNLVARVWNDDAEKIPGKTASSWVVLARKREYLGDRLCSPIGDLVAKYGDEQLYEVLRSMYPELKSLLDKPSADMLGTATSKQQETILQWLDKRTDDPQAKQFAEWIREYKSEYETLMTVLHKKTAYGFRPVRVLPGVDAWTDDYADVMRVMMIPELQAVREFFNLPTPVRR